MSPIYLRDSGKHDGMTGQEEPNKAATDPRTCLLVSSPKGALQTGLCSVPQVARLGWPSLLWWVLFRFSDTSFLIEILSSHKPWPLGMLRTSVGISGAECFLTEGTNRGSRQGAVRSNADPFDALSSLVEPLRRTSRAHAARGAIGRSKKGSRSDSEPSFRCPRSP